LKLAGFSFKDFVNVAKVRTNHPKNSLATFGYILDMKVGGKNQKKKKKKKKKKKQTRSILLAT